MLKLRIAFAVASVLTLVVLAVSPLKDYFREWKGYQERYNALLTTLPRRVEPVTIGIKQLWSQKLNAIDRCETCHLGIANSALAAAPQPYTTHPKIYHDVEEFGCTTCHGGQGRATSTAEAHGDVEYWEHPLLPARYAEAACGKCHKEEAVPSAPLLNQGRMLIRESNCVGCHKIEGYTKQWVPRLDGIGTKVTREWLVQWLKDPKAYDPVARMPNFLLTDEEANTLADFLMTFKAFPDNAQLEPLPVELASGAALKDDKLIEQGKTLFREARCISCHLVNGRGGTTAPELATVASKVSPAWLYTYIGNPKLLQPGVQMPRFGFTAGQRAAVVAYIESEFRNFNPDSSGPHVPAPGFYDRGLALFRNYNCAGCHTLGSMKGAAVMGPDLNHIGSKNLYEIDFGNSGIRQTLPSYLSTKLKSPRIFSSSMKMPVFPFTDTDNRAVTVALLAMTDDHIPDSYMVQPKPAQTISLQGAFGRLVDQMACLACHTMEGKGASIAPDLTPEASRAQAPWIRKYFKVPYSLRPILTVRMPNLFLSDSQINTIVDYMENVFVVDSLTRTLDESPVTVARGKTLYTTYGCRSCHQLNGQGGYVGPPLDHVGSRLTPGWIYHWVKDPQALQPTTIDPNNLLSASDAEALAAYLVSVK
jgi:mono/diheme cytochrome c family protein